MLTVSQVADLLDLSISSIRRFIRIKELSVHRLGRAMRISHADLAAFMARRRDGGEP